MVAAAGEGPILLTAPGRLRYQDVVRAGTKPSAARRLGLLATLALAASATAGPPYAVGDRVDPMTFETQHGREVTIGPATRLVLVTHDMDAGGIAKAVLTGHTAASLAARRAVYVADIAGMPGFVSRMFAIPRMRKRPYPVLLDRDAATARAFPTAEGKVTAVWLEEQRITRIDQLGSEAAVRTALAEADGPPSRTPPDGADGTR
jgi:hypothetical protein